MLRVWDRAYAQLSVCLRLATGSGTSVMRFTSADQLSLNKRVRGEDKILKLEEIRFDSWLTRRHSFKKSVISAAISYGDVWRSFPLTASVSRALADDFTGRSASQSVDETGRSYQDRRMSRSGSEQVPRRPRYY